MDRRQSWRSPVQILSFRILIVVPVLLAILTAITLFIHSDTNIVMLYSQCSARARLPAVSHIPVVGTLSCFLISFFQSAIDSYRASATMAAVLSFIGGLLTVYTVEGARICNTPNVLIAYPTGPLLIFTLMGGAIVWELLIIPAFFHRSRSIIVARQEAGHSALDATPTDPNLGRDMRHLHADAETFAIPAGVLIGFILPSVLMLVFKTPLAVAAWLLFPVWVALVRKAVRAAVSFWGPEPKSIHLESHTVSMAAVYAAPVLFSVVAHVFLLHSLFAQRDDRRQMTRSTLAIIQVDMVYVAFTVFYWLFVDVGWRIIAVVAAVSVVLGPGAGICAGWFYREHKLHQMFVPSAEDGDEESQSESGEDTPLLG